MPAFKAEMLMFRRMKTVCSVLYDRANSSFSTIEPGELDWKNILKNTKCLHLTGITPAVSESAAEAAMEAVKAAKACSCKVSLDMNYRAKLWSPAEANQTLAPMMDFVDILITTKGDTRTILGIEAENDEVLAKLLLDKYPIETVAVSYREGGSVWQCLFSAIAVNRESTYTTRTFNIEIVDQEPQKRLPQLQVYIFHSQVHPFRQSENWPTSRCSPRTS